MKIIDTSKLSIFKGRIKKLIAIAIILIGVAGLAASLSQIDKARALEPSKTFTSNATTPKTPSIALPYSVPTNISIPSVNINYPVMPVGEDATGGIQMPPILQKITGWYQYSPTPGQIGPSIIVGHVDNYETISVFWRLRYVKQGDPIYITRADGSMVTFKVTALDQFAQSNFPTKEVYGNINYPGLRLITCGGTFSKATESYNQNTVVFASIVANT